MIHIAFAHWNALNVATFRGALEWLDDTEHQYSSRFRDHIFRSEWQGGRILLRWLLSRITHRDPAQWRFKKEPSGRLTISKEISFGYSVSLSRAPGIAVAAIASGFPVGVDVEAVNAAG
ncbi:MAG TPA: hypothetical protein PK253_04695, partial [Spirochaetota bacterium]|nr:hypothetical protein [Spirochaetota bacterium]